MSAMRRIGLTMMLLAIYNEAARGVLPHPWAWWASAIVVLVGAVLAVGGDSE